MWGRGFFLSLSLIYALLVSICVCVLSLRKEMSVSNGIRIIAVFVWCPFFNVSFKGRRFFEMSFIVV
jgi:hypothetical protein